MQGEWKMILSVNWCVNFCHDTKTLIYLDKIFYKKWLEKLLVYYKLSLSKFFLKFGWQIDFYFYRQDKTSIKRWKWMCFSNWPNFADPKMENSTYKQSSNVLEESGNNFWVLPVAILPFVTVLGNLLVIFSVWREKTLQNSTNWLIVSLAFADLLVGLIVMPWGIYASVSD